MIIKRKRAKPRDCREWHTVFLWWPTRISEDRIAWLETVMRRRIVDDEGCWAGGYIYHWEYIWHADFAGYCSWHSDRIRY